MDLKDLILISSPKQVKDLKTDDNYLIELSKANYDSIKQNITKEYPPKSLEFLSKLKKQEENRSLNFEELVNDIAKENKTRTPNETKQKIIEYINKDKEQFLKKLKNDKGGKLVDQIIDMLEEAKKERVENIRVDKSLASKICKFLNEWLYGGKAYTINDSIIRSVLPYYLMKYNVKEYEKKNLDKISYSEFLKIYLALNKKVKDLNIHQMDQLLWYAYKNDSVRRSISIELAKSKFT